MPQPSYTIDTLTRLAERHPNTDFYLICGMDSLESFPKWKNYEMILKYHHLLVYPRKGYSSNELASHPSVKIIEAPEIEVSSTFIRNAIAEGKDVRYFVPKDVYKYIIDMHFYEKKGEIITSPSKIYVRFPETFRWRTAALYGALFCNVLTTSLLIVSHHVFRPHEAANRRLFAAGREAVAVSPKDFSDIESFVKLTMTNKLHC